MSEIIAAAVAALVALAVSVITEIREKEHLFADTVSSERMKWIREIRKLSVKLFTVCESCNGTPTPEQLIAFLEARNGILIRLNPDDAYYSDDQALIPMLEKDFAGVKNDLPQIRKYLMKILKSEWDKVKIEAGKSLTKELQMKKIQKKIEKERRNS